MRRKITLYREALAQQRDRHEVELTKAERRIAYLEGRVVQLEAREQKKHNEVLAAIKKIGTVYR